LEAASRSTRHLYPTAGYTAKLCPGVIDTGPDRRDDWHVSDALKEREPMHSKRRSRSERMTKTLLGAAVVAAVLSPAAASTQSAKSKPTTATYITREEVDTVNAKGPGTDRAIKVVDIGHENFALGIVHRGKTVNGVAVPAPGAAPNAAAAGGRSAAAPEPCGRQMPTAPTGGTAGGITHDSQTEGYYIV